MTTQNNLIEGETDYSNVECILDHLSNSDELKKPGYSVLIYGQGTQTRGFYKKLSKNPDVDILWTGWGGPRWSIIVSFIPGQYGLIKVKNLGSLKSIFFEVGALAYCSLCFVSEQIVTRITNDIKKDSYEFDLESAVKNETDYFVMDVDFDYDSGKRDRDVVYRSVKVGEGLHNNLRQILLTKE
jgi:hypothetical protein